MELQKKLTQERFQRRIVASFYGFQIMDTMQSLMSVDLPGSVSMTEAINAMEPDEAKREKIALQYNIWNTLAYQNVRMGDVAQVLVWQEGARDNR